MVRPAARRTPYIVLALGLAATALATQRLGKAASQRDEARFQNAVAGLRDQIRGKMDASVELLLGASGVFAADPGVDREAFQRYVDMLDLRERHPGMLGIGFARRVGQGELADLEREMRGSV
jgi:CHASE1-domain containing sensor protein